MAVKINKAMATESGLTIPTGIIGAFSVILHPVEPKITYQFVFYKDLATVQALGQPLESLADVTSKYTVEYEIAAYLALTQSDMEDEALALIEANPAVGATNCETITKDLLQPGGGG